MSNIGHNNPPDTTHFAAETADTLSAWLKENPVVQDETLAREGKALVDRAKGNLDEMERERDQLVRPLNEEVKQINGKYRGPREALSTIRDLVLGRLDDYRKAEEAKRRAAAEAAQRALEEAEEAARKSADLARERANDASMGVVGDVAETLLEAKQRERELEKASRDAARAEKATRIKIGGGLPGARALASRKTEILTVDDFYEAILEMGVTPTIDEAIKTAARAYRKAHGKLPTGITATYEESL